jgi:hypothetical protein
VPISFGSFLPEPLGKPCRDQRNSAGRHLPGGLVHPFDQPVIERERNLLPISALVLSASARPSVAVHNALGETNRFQRLALASCCRFACRCIAAISAAAALPLITVTFGAGFAVGLSG